MVKPARALTEKERKFVEAHFALDKLLDVILANPELEKEYKRLIKKSVQKNKKIQKKI